MFDSDSDGAEDLSFTGAKTEASAKPEFSTKTESSAKTIERMYDSDGDYLFQTFY